MDVKFVSLGVLFDSLDGPRFMGHFWEWVWASEGRQKHLLGSTPKGCNDSLYCSIIIVGDAKKACEIFQEDFQGAEQVHAIRLQSLNKEFKIQKWNIMRPFNNTVEE